MLQYFWLGLQKYLKKSLTRKEFQQYKKMEPIKSENQADSLVIIKNQLSSFPRNQPAELPILGNDRLVLSHFNNDLLNI